MGRLMYKNKSMFNLLAAIGIFISCSTVKKPSAMDSNKHANNTAIPGKTSPPGFLEDQLRSHPQYFAEILDKRNDWNVQVIYTQVNRDRNGRPDLIHHYFNLDPARYFYPASTVKLPVVLLALQKLNELKDKQVTRSSTMLTGIAFSGQTAVYNDPTTAGGKPSIEHYIKKILMVSDNDAYNRLYEFLGQEYINNELQKKGYVHAQVLHRLDIFLTEAENRQTNPVQFYGPANNLIYEQPPQNSRLVYMPRSDSIGNGYYKGGKLVTGKMDFSKKNRLGLEELHKIVLSVVFPEKVKASERFNITEEDRRFVLKYMSQLPTESVYPPYAADTASYWPAYCKFLLYGSQKGEVSKDIRIFNKVGDAYGHLIDAAYIIDHKQKIEFFVSAVIYCNSDGILNDDKYDYETIGQPFMRNLGKVLYEYELGRERKYRPDLSPFLFDYDNTPSKE
jgi:Beta-lactamase enzyme family